MKRPLYLALLLLLCCLLVVTCGKSIPSPRERVLDFVRLVQSDSLANILPFIDIDSVATYEYAGARYDSLSLQDKRKRLIDGFIGDGEYRKIWSRSQIVVNEENILNDTTATVEISFIDRATRIQYYSQMGLKKRGSNWVICSFKVN
jgi:hypothetical protein